MGMGTLWPMEKKVEEKMKLTLVLTANCCDLS